MIRPPTARARALSLVILAAGRSSRYGAPKPLVPVGPAGETLPEYTIHDALAAGFRRIVFVVHPDLEAPLRAHYGARRPAAAAFEFAVQRAPPGIPSRARPWGTVAAVVAAAPHVSGPFAVVNADDLYGAQALRSAALHLCHASADESALVAFRLADTLSAAGGVSRAVCGTGADGLLLDIEEVLELRQAPGGVHGRAARDGSPRTLGGDERVSMNLWAFQPAIMARLRAAYAQFVQAHAGDPDAECLIGEVVRELVRGEGARVRVLDTTARWYGITYPGDRDRLSAALTGLTADGCYPSPLRG